MARGKKPDGYVRISKREGEKVRHHYLGTLADPVNAVLVQCMELCQATNQASQATSAAEYQRQQQLEPPLRLLATKISQLLGRLRRQRGATCPASARKEIQMRNPSSSQPEVPLDRDDFDEIAEQAAEGNRDALEALKRLLHRHRSLTERLGSLGGHVQRVLTRELAGDSPIVREAIRVELDELRRQLSDPRAHPLERLLVEQVIATRLDETIQFIGCSRGEMKETLRRQWERRLERAQKRHQAAVLALAEVKTLLKPA